MDKVAKYREYIQTLLSSYARNDVSDTEVEVQLIFDNLRPRHIRVLLSSIW
jgi:hypothetical protein